MTREITLGLAQVDTKLGDLPANLNHVLEVSAEAAKQGVNIVVFPELVLTGYNQDLLGSKLHELAMTTEDEPIQELARAAKTHNMYLIAGFIEQRSLSGILYNSIVLCNPNGEIMGTYAKSHLFATEKLHFRPGQEFQVHSIPEGKLGPMICMDIGYPEAGRLLALEGAELLVAPSAWILEDEDLWGLHLRSRALDNFVFVAGINRAGSEGDLNFIGQSMVVNPRGHVLAQLDDKEGLLVTTIDLDEVALSRRKALHLTGRRPELYGPITDMT